MSRHNKAHRHTQGTIKDTRQQQHKASIPTSTTRQQHEETQHTQGRQAHNDYTCNQTTTDVVNISLPYVLKTATTYVVTPQTGVF